MCRSLGVLELCVILDSKEAQLLLITLLTQLLEQTHCSRLQLLLDSKPLAQTEEQRLQLQIHKDDG